MSASSNDGPFSFAEINDPKNHRDDLEEDETISVDAGDGTKLSVRVFRPTASGNGTTVLVFYHGGGAHSGAGYQMLARGLSSGYGITVYLPDIRGHGSSGGDRGDAPSPDAVWSDVDSVLERVKSLHENDGDTKIYLGGHSSGGGLVVNYGSWRTKRNEGGVPLEGYVLVAPMLGHKSATDRPDQPAFASANVLYFILNGIFGVLGHSKGVKFNYPKDVLEGDPGMVAFNTVNMACAITPESPKEQILAMANGGDTPIALWIGAGDELFLPEAVVSMVPTNASATAATDAEGTGSAHERNTSVVLPGETHLGILVKAHEKVGPWITE